MKTLDFHVHYTGNAGQVDRFVADWRERGVEKAVLFAFNYADGSFPTVDEIDKVAKRYPDFFIPFGYLNLGIHDCMAETRKAIERGFKGLKFIFPAKPYDEDEYFPIYEMAAKAGMVCLFHTGIVIGTSGGDYQNEYQRKWRVSSNYMRPACLDRIARVFPEMTIVGAHLGGRAWYEEATQVMYWNANVYFDLCIGQLHYVRRGIPEGQEQRAIKPRMQQLYDEGQLNLSKVVFGSDAMMGKEGISPNWAMKTVQFELDAIGATEAEKAAVRWNTAAKILGIGESERG